MVGVVRSAECPQRLVQHFAGVAQLDAQHDQVASVDVPPLAHPRHLQTVDNVYRCQHFWKNQRVDAHPLEELFARWVQILEVVNAGYRLLGSQGMGYHACIHVAALVGSDAHKEVGILHTSLLHGVDAGGAPLQRHDVITAVKVAQTVRVLVYEHAVLMVARQ